MVLEIRQSHALMLERLDRHTAAVQQRVREITTTADESRRSDVLGQARQPQPGISRQMLGSDEEQQRIARKRRQKNSSRQTWRLRLSPRFITRVCEISLSLNIAIRTSHLVPHNSIIFEACRGGDMREVLTLFQRGEASPFDHALHYGGWAGGTTVLGVSLQ